MQLIALVIGHSSALSSAPIDRSVLRTYTIDFDRFVSGFVAFLGDVKGGITPPIPLLIFPVSTVRHPQLLSAYCN